MSIDPAATVVLLDDADPPRVLLLKRHRRSPFMANAYVFPGGRLDSRDASMPRVEGFDAEAFGARMRGLGEGAAARALLVCAVRETFEESGLLLARTAAGAWPGPEVAEVLPASRDALLDARVCFEDVLADHDLRIAAGDLVYFDHWITPPLEKRRFDTRFFLASTPPHQVSAHDQRETTESLWITPAEAITRHESGELGFAPPTYWVLRVMADLHHRDAIAMWARAREVPTILPTIAEDAGRLCVALPGDPLHPGTRPADGAPRRLTWQGTHWVRFTS